MKAYSLKAINQLEYIDVSMPECPNGWSIVKVKASGICSSDIPRIYKKGTYHFPTIPGHEFSGVVERVGSEKDSYLVGRRVSIFPLIPCRTCKQCELKRYEMCSNYDYVGSRRDGGFAEYVAVPVWNLIDIKDSVQYEEAAMLEPLSVALHAVKIGEIKEADSVAIIGTGMIGFAAAQWAKAKGASRVTVVGRSETKRILAEGIGVEYSVMDSVEEEFDVVIEAVGSNQAIDKAINMVKPSGRLVLMGNPEGDITLTQKTYWRILRKQLKLSGTWNSSYENNHKCDWSEAMDALADHKIEVKNLISHRFDQDHLVDGLELMLNHVEPYCKVMTIWNEEG